jgi:hypothetical protein
VVAAVLGAVVWWFSNYQAQHKAYVQAGKFTVNRTQYERMKIEAQSDDKLSPSAYKTQLTTLAKRKAVAQQLSIAPSQAEITSASDKLYPNTQKPDEWQQLKAYSAALDASIQRLAVSRVSGYIYIFPFSAAPTGPPPVQPSAQPKQATVSRLPAGYDAKAVAAYTSQLTAYSDSRNYAQQQAESYRDKLVNGKLSDQAVLKAIKSDKKLGGSDNKSRSVSTDSVGWTEDSNYRYIASDLLGFGKVGVGLPTLGQKAQQASANNQPVTEDTYYYFYHITTVVPGKAGLPKQFQTALSKQTVKVTVPKEDE